jgi:hypothetical protein
MRTGFFSGEDCWLLHESTVLWLRDSYSIRVRKKRKVFLCRCFEPAGMSGLEKNILGFVPCLKTRPGNCFQRLISPALDATGSMTVRCNAMNPCGHLGKRTLRMLSKAISAGFNLPPSCRRSQAAQNGVCIGSHQGSSNAYRSGAVCGSVCKICSNTAVTRVALSATVSRDWASAHWVRLGRWAK